jgi:hypothetical protein
MNMRLTKPIAALSAPMVLIACAAYADDNLNCDAYAAKAIQQHQQSQSLGCGFTGGAWSSDANAHRNWCRLPTVNMANLVTEDNARTAALAACLQLAAACDQYAALAVEQSKMAQGCGFSGAAWHNDAGVHRAWCMTAAAAAAEHETTARNAAIMSCAAQLANVNLQNQQQRMNQIMQTMSNIAKAMHDSQMEVIRKIGN